MEHPPKGIRQNRGRYVAGMVRFLNSKHDLENENDLALQTEMGEKLSC